MTSHQAEMSAAEAERLLAGFSHGKGVGKEITDVQFALGVRWKPADVRGVRFSNLGWHRATIIGRLLGRGRVQDCRFEKVNADDFRCRKVDFVDCQFEAVTFGEHYFGNVRECSFSGCSFVKCRFDAVGFVESTFRSCRFEAVRGERTQWRNCSLEDVTMSGRLAKAQFIDSGLRKVDLSRVEFLDSGILGGEQNEVRLPDEPRNFAVDPKIMLAAEEALRSKLNPEALARYRHFAEGAAQVDSRFLINPEVLSVLSPESREVVMATLYEMRHSSRS